MGLNEHGDDEVMDFMTKHNRLRWITDVCAGFDIITNQEYHDEEFNEYKQYFIDMNYYAIVIPKNFETKMSSLMLLSPRFTIRYEKPILDDERNKNFQEHARFVVVEDTKTKVMFVVSTYHCMAKNSATHRARQFARMFAALHEVFDLFGQLPVIQAGDLNCPIGKPNNKGKNLYSDKNYDLELSKLFHDEVSDDFIKGKHYHLRGCKELKPIDQERCKKFKETYYGGIKAVSVLQEHEEDGTIVTSWKRSAEDTSEVAIHGDAIFFTKDNIQCLGYLKPTTMEEFKTENIENKRPYRCAIRPPQDKYTNPSDHFPVVAVFKIDFENVHKRKHKTAPKTEV